MKCLARLLLIVLPTMVVPIAASQDFSLRLIERNSLRLETPGAPPIIRQASDLLSEQLSGTEHSECRSYGRQSAATANADVRELSRRTDGISFSVSAAASTQGGHYRTCFKCSGDTCVIVDGNDTTANASAQSIADVAVVFDKDAAASPYLVDVVASSSGRPATLKMVGPTGSEIAAGEDGSYPIDAQAGATYLLQVVADSISSNRGMCCHDDITSAVTLDVRVRKAPLLMYKHNLEPLIAGGLKTAAYPSVGAIMIDGQMHCTATIVGQRTILTAAHCLHGYEAQLSKFTFLVGAAVATPDVPPTRIIEFQYPTGESGEPYSYNPKTYEDDIGVAYLEQPATQPPISLHKGDPGWSAIQGGGTKLVFVGYGYDVVSGEKVQDGIKRAATWPINLVENRRVAFYVHGKSTCKGDSGGPAFLVAGNQITQVGITSTGTEDCRRGYETRVDAFAPWLQDRIR